MQVFILWAAIIALFVGVAVVRNYWLKRNLRVAGGVAVGTIVLVYLLFLLFISF